MDFIRRLCLLALSMFVLSSSIPLCALESECVSGEAYRTIAETVLVDIRSINPHIQIDLKYATSDNFTGQKVYQFNACLLLEPVAKALDCVQQELEQQGLGLKVWDGFRPLSAQWKFWEICPDERYVSDPQKVADTRVEPQLILPSSTIVAKNCLCLPDLMTLAKKHIAPICKLRQRLSIIARS